MDILESMTFNWVLLLAMGVWSAGAGDERPFQVRLAQALEQETQEASQKLSGKKDRKKKPDSKKIKTEADLWSEPAEERQEADQPDQSENVEEISDDEIEALDQEGKEEPEKERPGQQESEGGWGVELERDQWGDEERIEKALQMDDYEKKEADSQPVSKPKTDPQIPPTKPRESTGSGLVPAVVKASPGSLDEPESKTSQLAEDQQILPLSGTLADLSSLWRKRRIHLKQRDIELARGDLQLFLELKRELGIRNLVLEANVLIREARRAEQAESLEEAQALAKAAVELAPDLPDAYLTQASMWFSESPLRLGRVVGSLAEALRASFRDPLIANRFWVNLLIGLLLGFGLVAVVYVVVQFLRVSNLYLHDFHHFFPKGATRLQTGLLAVTLVVFPILFRLGLIVTLLIWALVGWCYQQRFERLVTFLVVVFLSVVPLALQAVVSGLHLPVSLAPDLLNITQGSVSQESLNRIGSRLKEQPDDPVALAALGYFYKRSGRLEQASKYLQKAVELRSGSAVLANNLGNVLFLQGDIDKAVEHYVRATQSRPDLAVPYYNLSRAYYKKMDLNKGKQHRTLAQRLDAESVQRLAEQAKSRKFNHVVSDLPIPTSWLVSTAKSDPQANRWNQAAQHIWRAWGGVGSVKAFPFVGAAVVLCMGLILLVRKRLWLSGSCVRCGRPACRRCNRELREDTYCGQCFHAFVRKDQVDARSKISKEIQIRQFLRRRDTIARGITFVLPGVGQLLKERSLKGALFLTVFCLMLVQVLLGGGAMRDLHTLGGGIDWLKLMPLLLVLVGFYFWAILDIFRVGR